MVYNAEHLTSLITICIHANAFLSKSFLHLFDHALETLKALAERFLCCRCRPPGSFGLSLLHDRGGCRCFAIESVEVNPLLRLKDASQVIRLLNHLPPRLLFLDRS